MRQYDTATVGNGTRLQAGVPKRLATGGNYIRADGLLLRGVVVATWVVDDPTHAAKKSTGVDPEVIYCDVLCYSSNPLVKWRVVKNALVAQSVAGIQRGRIWKPRAANIDITKSQLDKINKGGNPAHWDGDHVLIGFLDNSLNLPIILGAVAHPSIDIGNEDYPIGQRRGSGFPQAPWRVLWG
jgi:hypothetical protein